MNTTLKTSFLTIALSCMATACATSVDAKKDDAGLAEICWQIIKKREPSVKGSDLSKAKFLYDKENNAKVTVSFPTYLPNFISTIEKGQDFVRIDGQRLLNVNGKCRFDKSEKKVHVSVYDRQIFDGGY